MCALTTGLQTLDQLTDLVTAKTFQNPFTINLALLGFHGPKDWASDMTNGKSELAVNF